MEKIPQEETPLTHEPVVIGSGIRFTEEMADIVRREQRQRGLSSINPNGLTRRVVGRRPKPVPTEPADIERMVNEADAEMRKRDDTYSKKLMTPLDIAVEL